MIYHIIENTCYQSLTNGLAIPNLAKKLNIEYKSYSLEDWNNYHIDQDNSNKSIFITESAFHRARQLKELRKKIPNGKIVNLGSDSIYYTFYNNNEIEVYPELVDLWLDTMEQPVEHYSRMNIPADLWKWTISEVYIEQIQALSELKAEKVIDGVCLAQLNSLYRQELKKHLEDSGYCIQWGDGTISSELLNLQKLYGSAYVCIGTTSSAGKDTIRSMKGWRDWIAPFFGTLLIYDDHPEMEWAEIPKYRYDDVINLMGLINGIKNITDKKFYKSKVEEQQDFIKNYTIEKQLEKLFIKHNIIEA